VSCQPSSIHGCNTQYLGPLVVYGDLVVLVRIFAGEKLLERLFDVYLEAARLQGDFV
jgi:hypothetical protein